LNLSELSELYDSWQKGVEDSDISLIDRVGVGPARKQENREFVAWDGEGITFPNNSQQNYVLYGNSKGYSLSSENLGTIECLELMMQTERDFPYAIHVGFAFSYDVEMILKDVPLHKMRELKKFGFIRWEGYRIEFRKSKWFVVSKDKVVCKIWDVWSFFSTSFVVALREYLGNNEEVEFISAGKLRRNDFEFSELESMIRPYWEAELRTMVLLMNTLRTRLYDADLRIVHWHGPGAIATHAMTQKGVKKAMAIIPEKVGEASRFAYAGGRFELFKIGYHHETAYSYDIRSAYPSAIRNLPNLTTGTWEHVTAPKTISTFGVYRIKFSHSTLMTTRPMPFYYRDMRSAVHFPNIVEGWYWSPEAKIAEYLGDDAEILEGWVYTDTGERPFSWIEDTYNLRAEWKAAGNPSQIALKLLMNSMYGKFAQRVGYKGKESPQWHQLEWAGFITSHCRAKLFQAMLEANNKGSLIAVETDGIFTSQPLELLTVGNALGEWGCETYESLIYLQSGFYFKKPFGKEWQSRSRGFDKGSITVEDAIAALGKWRPWENEAPLGSILGTMTRFTTMGQYLTYHNPEKWRRTWVTTVRELKLGTDGKRVHRPLFCQACTQGISPVDIMHDMTIYQQVGGHTYPHILPWLDNRVNPFRNIEDGIKL